MNALWVPLFVPLPLLPQVLRLAYVSSMATKMSDTAASEVGKAYGKTAYLVTTLAVVPRGTEGAVSVEGTAAGVVASLAMGALAVAVGLIPLAGVPVVAVAAAVATTAESIIGATVQEDVRARGGGCPHEGGRRGRGGEVGVKPA